MSTGFFITFEGGEGSGKTTQLLRAADRLRAAGFTVVVTREPGGCPIADAVRTILLDAANRAMVPLTELLLYAGARAQHVSEVIAPALAAGNIVICDRFTDSTLAYQGYGRQLDRELITQLNALATGPVKPDLTLILDCPAALGLSRAMARINASPAAREERFEQESLLFHERIRTGYHDQAVAEPQRCLLIDGSGSIEATETLVMDAILPRLPRR